MSELTDKFYELFQGREDVVFVDGPFYPPQQRKLEPEKDGEVIDHIVNHLSPGGPYSIGIYPLRDGTDCRWICSDFDDELSEEHAFKLANTWVDYGIQAWVETSKSKGHHVWVFIDDWCPGIIARRAALWVHQVADVPAIEVNPKQEITDGYGNCVRLPYWARREPGRMEMVATYSLRSFPTTGRWSLKGWVEEALAGRTTVDALKKLAVKWQPPAPPEPVERPEGGFGTNRDFSGELTDLECRDIYKGNRDVPAGNRDNSLFAVANYMRGIELDEGEAIQVMTEIWNDQVEQPSGDVYPLRIAIDKVRKVYATR